MGAVFPESIQSNCWLGRLARSSNHMCQDENRNLPSFDPRSIARKCSEVVSIKAFPVHKDRLPVILKESIGKRY